MYKLLDPFGIAAAYGEVQKAWWAHPFLLNEELLRFGARSLALATWQQFAGARVSNDLVPPAAYDERFSHPLWNQNPYLATLKKYYLLYSQWLVDAIYKTPNLPDRTKQKAAFWTSEFLNGMAPTNFFWTNPEAIMRAIGSGGRTCFDGWLNFVADATAGKIRMVDEAAFEVGINVATTPGAVVYRNKLVELIQYEPTTEKVHAMPIVIVAPWINKYYILDINERQSLVRHLVAQGFTVFVTSWKNPGADMRDTTFDDYMLQGVLACINAAREISRSGQVHLAGYCIGGTLVTALAAWLQRAPDRETQSIVAHMTLLTALVDFSKPGEMSVYIDDDSLDALNALMELDGFLDGKDMTMSFRTLRSNSLIWHHWVQNYLLGETPPAFDVLYWNSDSTRMPHAMHSFYLREFYLHNKLVQPDALILGRRPIDLSRITQSIYAVGTEQDHIAPWKSAFRICALANGPVRFVVATSGHIMGVLSPPVDPPKRRYWMGDATGHDDPDRWLAQAEKVSNSWWTDWYAWLKPRCGKLGTPPTMGNEDYPQLAPAPGDYVLER